MLKFLAGGTLISRIFVWLAIAALVFGFAGTVQKNFAEIPEPSIGWVRAAKVVVDSFVQNFRVFVPRLDGLAGSDNWSLTIGRLMGSIVAFAATFAVLIRVFRQDVSRLRLSVAKGHSVIIGHDRTARTFAKAFKKGSNAGVVILDPESSSSTQEKAFVAGYHYLAEAVGQLGKALRSCRARKAAEIVISTGNDETNLELLSELSSFTSRNADSSFVLTVCLEDARLVETLERDEEFYAIGGRKVQTRIFNLARQTASRLLQRTTFIDQALTRKQGRVSLVVIGDSDVAVELVLQCLRISPAVGLTKPRVDWIVPDTALFLGRLNTRNETLARLVQSTMPGRVQADDTPLAWALDVQLHQAPAGSLLPDRDLMSAVEAASAGGGTSIIVAAASDEDSVSLALVLRARATRLNTWQAPIYALSPNKSALDIYLRKRKRTAEESEPRFLKDIKEAPEDRYVVEPFGRTDDVCAGEAKSGSRDHLAQRVHQAYLEQRKADLGRGIDPSSDPSTREWHQLQETYRLASRRAADHIRVKLVCAGISQEGVTGLKSSLADQIVAQPELLEALARTEHDAWRIDRELDSWRFGPTRDNHLRLHPDLVPYDELSDQVREYDRAQVRLLTTL
jgi:hypothetical protein